MKKKIMVLLCGCCIFIGCSKDNDDDEENGGGGGGNQGLSGHYIIKTLELCPAGTFYFIGFKLSGNLVDHEISLTMTDTLNSWYLQKTGADRYMIYAKLGNQFLLWKQGPEQVALGQTEYLLKLEQVAVLPPSPSAEQQFQLKENAPANFNVTAANGWRVKTYTGGRKTPFQCSRTGGPNIRNTTGCIDRLENEMMQYCFQEELVFQKIN